MTDINDFFKMMADAQRDKEEKKKIEEERRAIELQQKVEAAKPYLEDLFKVVSDSKKAIEEKKAEEKKKAEPILNQLQQALSHPEEFKKATKEKKKKVLEVVKELEEKAAELEEKLAEAETSSNIEEKIEENKLEKKFLDLFKLLQDDITALKRQIANTPTTPIWGGGGGGEVNLRYLDDIDRSTIQNGRILSYDDSDKKFKFVEQSAASFSLTKFSTQLSGKIQTIQKQTIPFTNIVSYRIVDSAQKDVSIVITELEDSFVIESNINMSVNGLTFFVTGY